MAELFLSFTQFLLNFYLYLLRSNLGALFIVSLVVFAILFLFRKFMRI